MHEKKVNSPTVSLDEGYCVIVRDFVSFEIIYQVHETSTKPPPRVHFFVLLRIRFTHADSQREHVIFLKSLLRIREQFLARALSACP